MASLLGLSASPDQGPAIFPTSNTKRILAIFLAHFYGRAAADVAVAAGALEQRPRRAAAAAANAAMDVLEQRGELE